MAIVDFDHSLEILKSEDVLGLPTETVYGLAARIDSEKALRKIFSTKKRPFFDPLIVHLAEDFSPRDLTSEWSPLYEALAEKFWPGPLTLIAPKNQRISDLITAGLPDVGLRKPSHPLAQKVLKALGIPLAAPSANMFGKTSPTAAAHVEEEFQGKVAVLDGGGAEIGVESTVVRYEPTEKTLFILRPGFISKRKLMEVAKDFSVKVTEGASAASPGQLKAHYQPKAPVVLEFTEDTELSSSRKTFLEERLEKKNLRWQTLKLPEKPEWAARVLYGQLRELSREENSAIWIPSSKVHQKEEWVMILDRLTRAASLVV
jgi:L-threonylcarbamoyladenylate synthase